MNAVDVAVLGATLYFFVFGAGFLFRPELAAELGLAWINPAGRTEVRCYYGAVSWALGAYFAWLWTAGEGISALTGVLALASAVLATRIVGTVLDGAGREKYTRLAIPIELGFVIVLGAIRATA